MSYAADFSLNLGSVNAGATLKAAIVGTDGKTVSHDISTGFTEIGNGSYQWHYATFANGQRGGVVFYSGTYGGSDGSTWDKTQVTGGTIFGDVPLTPDLEYIDAKISSIGGTGTGARTVTITVNDGSTALESAKVRFTKGAESYVGTTNASGQIVFSLDDGTWDVAITLPLYSFTPTTLAISADTSHTYSMTALSFTVSPAGETTGYIYCYDKNGDPVENMAVEVRAIGTVDQTTGFRISSESRTELSDSDGLVQFPGLLANTKYQIRMENAQTHWRDFTIDADPDPTTTIVSTVA